jgi:hypothetical protein
VHCVFSFIRTVTVGPGIAPDLLTSSLSARGLGLPLTAGGEFRPALRIFSFDTKSLNKVKRDCFDHKNDCHVGFGSA